MTPAHPLDAGSATRCRRCARAADLAAFEATPYAERIGHEAPMTRCGIGAALDPDGAGAPLPAAMPIPDETPLHHLACEFFARVTQAANAFHALGVGAGDVVSLLLPLLPQAFFALFGAEAAGIANPVNPLLVGGADRRDPARRRTKVLVTLGPVPGSDI